MTKLQQHSKRSIDFIAALLGLLVLFPLIFLGFLLASASTGKNGLYRSKRIGQNAKTFFILKLRSMKKRPGIDTSVTTSKDPRVTKTGRFLRRTKLDELPQLWNVLIGEMSLVGPRPDVAGFADKLEGEDRIILSLKPGITGLATLAFKNEEELLSQQTNPEKYNQEVIWPEKIRLNKLYIKKYSVALDFKILWQTFF